MATSCHRDNETADDDVLAQQDSSVLHVAVIPCKDCLPIYYAEQTGIYHELGLDVQILNYPSQLDTDTALLFHHADVAYSDLIRVMMLQQKDCLDVRAIRSTTGELTLVASRRRRIKKTSQLKERMVAVARHSITDYWSDRVVEEVGLERKLIFRPQINNLRLRTDMLCNATMDAAFLPEPFATEATYRGNNGLMNTAKEKLCLTAFAVPQAILKDTARIRQIELLWEGYNTAVQQLNSGTTDSLLVLLQRYCQTPDSIRSRVAEKLLPFDTLTYPQHQDIIKGYDWLQSRNQIRDGYSPDHILVK